MAMNQDFVLDLLVSMMILTEEQAEQTRFTVGETGEYFLDVLEKLEFTTQDQVIGTLAMEYGMETFDLTDYRIPADIIELIDKDIARRYHIVPVMSFDSTVTIAVSDPTDLETLDSLR